MIGLPTETKDVQGQQVPLPSDAVRRAATRLPTDAHGEQLPLPSDAEKRAAQGQPPAGPFGEPPPPPPPPADRQAERDRKLQAILAGGLARFPIHCGAQQRTACKHWGRGVRRLQPR